MAKRKANKPEMREREIFVQYVYKRRCRNNPSMDRFWMLPIDTQVWLRARWKRDQEKKHGR